MPLGLGIVSRWNRSSSSSEESHSLPPRPSVTGATATCMVSTRSASVSYKQLDVYKRQVYEVANEGEYYNTAAVIDSDGSYLGKYRKHHLPNLPSFWEKFYFRPGNLGYPVFDTAVGRVGVYILSLIHI